MSEKILKLKPAGRWRKDIVSIDGRLVGVALQLANNRWAPFDANERRLVDTGISFPGPREVLQFFKAANRETEANAEERS